MTEADGYTVVGKSFPRLDALDKVAGKGTYGVDVKLPGMLHAKVLRSPHPHARIMKVDTSKAKARRGVKAVLTAKDLPKSRYGLMINDQTVLANDKVRFVGEAVAAVAARDEDAASEALGLITVEYEKLPEVTDPEEAMKPDAPLIHEELAKYWCVPLYARMVPGTNICNYFKLRKGDVEDGFSQSDFCFENRFKIQMVHHCYMEPHAAVAKADPSGKVTILTNTQAPYQVREDVSRGLQIPLGKLRVIGTKVGGGFGGKIPANIEPFCVALAQRTGWPVKMVLTRTEEFLASCVRHPAVIEIKAGVKKDGRLLSLQMNVVWDTGGYAEHGPAVSRQAGFSAAGPYDIPHVKIDSYCVYTNNPVAGAFRGFGMAQTAWALESQLDIMARELGIDPLEFRLKNAVKDGSVLPTGEILESVAIRQCLEEVAKKIDWGMKAPQGQGKGIAALHKTTRGFAPSCAIVKLNEDGTIGVLTSAMDIGQGSETVLAQIAAEEMGVSIDQVFMAMPDTDTTPFDVGTLSSRITFHMGNAIKLAATDAKRQLFCLAGEQLEARPEDLEIKNSRVYVKGSPHKSISLAELSILSHTFKAGPILGRGSFLKEDLALLDPETGQGGKATEYWKYSAHAAQVKVDVETGQVELIRLAAAADAGRAINPLSVQGQLQGAALMGVGSALLEEMVLDKGRVINPSFMDYNLPTAMDVPRLDPIIVEVPHPDGPFGAKGIGEGATPPAGPAIANALCDAVGVRINELPLTPERVWNALKMATHKGAFAASTKANQGTG